MTEKKKRKPVVKYSDEVAGRICKLMLEGKSVRAICRENEDMPEKSTIYDWLQKKPDFREAYEMAIAIRAHDMFDECLEIADETDDDFVGDPEDRVVNGEHIARSRLRIETRKWMAGRMLPKVYGDKMALTGGSESDAPLKVQSVDDRVLARQLAHLLVKESREPS